MPTLAITVNWYSPSDADTSTRYEIKRVLPSGSSTTLAAAQPQSGAAGSQQTYNDSFDPTTNKWWRYEIRRFQNGGSEYTPILRILAANPSPPANDNLCTVYGLLREHDDDPQAGVAITATAWYNNAALPNAFSAKGEQIKFADVQTTTDSTGYFEIALWRSAKIAKPVGVQYRLVFNNGVTMTITVPDLMTADHAGLA